MKTPSRAVQDFLGLLDSKRIQVRQNPFFKENVYVLNGTRQVLVRSSKFFHKRGYYFFGLTKSVLENFSKEPHAQIAFICSDTMKSYIVPAKVIYEIRETLSSNEQQYKVEIGDGFILFPAKSRTRRVDLRPYLDEFGPLRGTTQEDAQPEREPAPQKHADVQGMLLEIGNIRGYDTYTPNRSWAFRGKPLGEYASLSGIPASPGVPGDVAGRVDVLWFKEDFPTDAFEVEISTGVWTGLVRLGEFLRLSTRLHVITPEQRPAFDRRLLPYLFRGMVKRCGHATIGQVQELYKMESALAKLKKETSI